MHQNITEEKFSVSKVINAEYNLTEVKNIQFSKMTLSWKEHPEIRLERANEFSEKALHDILRVEENLRAGDLLLDRQIFLLENYQFVV